MASFAQKITAGNAKRNIYLITGGKDHTGRPAWYYVRVEDHLKLRFERAIKAGAIELSEFGTILESGYGAHPSEATRAQMKEQYGFED